MVARPVPVPWSAGRSQFASLRRTELLIYPTQVLPPHSQCRRSSSSHRPGRFPIHMFEGNTLYKRTSQRTGDECVSRRTNRIVRTDNNALAPIADVRSQARPSPIRSWEADPEAWNQGHNWRRVVAVAESTRAAIRQGSEHTILVRLATTHTTGRRRTPNLGWAGWYRPFRHRSFANPGTCTGGK